jgi:hypothetical protein
MRSHPGLTPGMQTIYEPSGHQHGGFLALVVRHTSVDRANASYLNKKRMPQPQKATILSLPSMTAIRPTFAAAASAPGSNATANTTAVAFTPALAYIRQRLSDGAAVTLSFRLGSVRRSRMEFRAGSPRSSISAVLGLVSAGVAANEPSEVEDGGGLEGRGW